jgi:hypothetical protein
MGSSGNRRRKPLRRLARLKGSPHGMDEPPVMWSPPGSGFEASPLSPAGEMQNFWRLTGGGSDLHEADARRQRRRPLGRLGSLLLRLLGLDRAAERRDRAPESGGRYRRSRRSHRHPRTADEVD